MKTNLLLLFSLLCVTVFRVHAQDGKMISAKLIDATVFFKGAELTHETTVPLQKGSNEIKISGLSPILDKNSIKIKTSSGALVSSFEFSTEYLNENTSGNDEVKKIEENIENYKKQIIKINTNLKINKELLSMLQKGITKNIEGSENGMNINDLKQTLEYYKGKALETEELIRVDNDEKQKIEDNIQKMQLQLNQKSKKNDKLSGALTLNLMAVNAGNCIITINYYTVAACWIPYYDINVQSIQKPIKITTKAKISQTSGIDWDKVKLSLSTYTPNLEKVAPLFKTWFLWFIQPYYEHLSEAKMQNSYTYHQEIAPEVVYEKDAQYSEDITMNNYVQESENQLNVVYDISLPYTIVSNGKELNIELKNQEVSAQFKYYSVPKLDVETYLIGEIGDWQKLNLLNGKANITYDGTHIGETYINASSVTENLTLTLGSDKRVPVQREKLTEYNSKKVAGGEIKQIFAYQLTVRNNQNVPVSMTLKDQYPVSTQKEISVELLKETTAWNYNNTDVGVISWDIELQPGEQKIFKIAYSVKYPKDKMVNL